MPTKTKTTTAGARTQTKYAVTWCYNSLSTAWQDTETGFATKRAAQKWADKRGRGDSEFCALVHAQDTYVSTEEVLRANDIDEERMRQLKVL